MIKIDPHFIVYIFIWLTTVFNFYFKDSEHDKHGNTQ